MKTLADSDANSINPSIVTPISIRDLNGFPRSVVVCPSAVRLREEFRVFEVLGRITYIAHEDDHDYHIALEDPVAPRFTVVTELADTLCQDAVLSPHLTTNGRAEHVSDAAGQRITGPAGGHH